MAFGCGRRSSFINGYGYCFTYPLMNKTRKHYVLAIPPWIILGALALLVPIFLFWTVESIHKQRQDMIRLLTEKGAALIRSFEAGARTGMMGMMGMRGGNFRLQRLLTETAQQADIVYIVVTDDHGKILADSDPDHIGENHGTDLDLQKLADSDAVQWRQVPSSKGPDVFEVFRRFAPTQPGPRGSRMGWPTQRNLPEPGTEQAGEIIFVGLDMGPLNAALKEDMQHTLFMALVLLLIGFAGVVSLFLAHAYRTTRTSLSRIKAFSDRVVENMPVGLLAADESGRIVSFNRAAEEILRQSSSEMMGRSLQQVLPPEVMGLASELKEEGSAILEDEIECHLQDGTPLYLDVSVSLLQDSEETTPGRLILFRDLTEVQSLKREIETSRRLASLGRLAAGIAHEIRNPLSSIKGFATYFKERYRDNPDDQKTSEVMIQEVDRLNRVITQLLEFARPPAIQKKRASLQNLIQHSLKMIERQASAKHIRVFSHLQSEIKEVDLDPDGISQVLLNLYLNAVEAMDQGGTLTVSLSMEEGASWVKIRVSDTGAGISKEDLEHIFDPYFTTKQTGTGLGLAIVHKIIEAHGGDVRVESDIGRGTTVSVLLPLTRA
jgi:two-component system, NtrC family, sensor histidine kinase HydH